MKARGVFITFEGIGTTIFDSQVALHALEMRQQDVDLEIWAFETWPGMFRKSKARLKTARELAESQIRLFRGVLEYLPLSDVVNTFLLIYHLKRLRPDVSFIHARADYSAAICSLAARWWRIPVIWDCRGDSEAEFDDAYQPRHILGRIAKCGYLTLIRWRTDYVARCCTRAVFVSEELRRRKGKALGNKISRVIPTPVSDRLFFVSDNLRQITRSQLGFIPGHRVLLYSGAMTGYQGFEAYVKMFNALYKYDSTLRFLVATPDLDRASGFLGDLPYESYTLVAAEFADMNALCNAADFGVLLRRDSPVNEVASPTKFGEYCLAGLPIVMNDSVRQSYQFAREFGNLVSFRDDLTPDDLKVRTAEERSGIAEKARIALSRTNLAHHYVDLYTVQSD